MPSARPFPTRSDQPPSSARAIEWLLVAWFTALFVLAIGVTNGDTPQNSYLLLGLRLADPGFVPGDWYTWDTVHSHPFFALIVAGLARLGPLAFGLTLGMVLQNGALAVALYTVFRKVYEPPLLPWAATLALFAAFDATSLGSEPWVKSFLGVSSLAGVAMVIAISLLMRHRHLAGGIWLGISALVHAHFFVLSLPVMLAAAMAAWWEGGRRVPVRICLLMGLGFGLVSIPTILQLIRFATAPGAAEIHWLTASLFPYHLAPQTWPREPFLVLAGALALGSGGLFLRLPRVERTLPLMLAIVGLTVFASLALAWSGVSDLAAQTWPWRLSPILLLAGLGAGMGVIARPDPMSADRQWTRSLGLGLLLTGAVVIAAVSPPRVNAVLLALCLLPVALGVVEGMRDRWKRFAAAPLLAGVALISLSFAPVLLRSFQTSHFEFRAERPERAMLYEWVRNHTPEDAVFLIPPTWEKFRTIARRPIVVDWKTISRYPPDRIEWVERMSLITGVERPSADGRALDEGYARMDCTVAGTARARYRARYVVHELPKALPCGQVVYEDEHFRIWDLEAGSGR